VSKEKRPGPRARTALLVGAGAAALMLALGILLGTGLLGVGPFGRPDRAEVERSFTSYLSGIAEAGYLVLVEAKHELYLRDVVAGRLFGDGAVGRFLNIRSDAVIELSAWADLYFVVDLSRAELWSLRYDPAAGGRLILALPPLSFLTPALRSDTIQARAADRSLFLNEATLIDSAKRALSARFVEAASAMLDDPELRAKAASSLQGLAKAFAEKTGVPIARVEPSFAPPDR
jgi:hypothetical protein